MVEYMAEYRPYQSRCMIIIGLLFALSITKTLSELVEISRSSEDPAYNMTLYKQDGTKWQEALGVCQNKGQELVSVSNKYIQDRITQWLSGLSDTDRPGNLWTSGHQSNDTFWRYLDGTKFTGNVTIGDDGNCVYDKGVMKRYIRENCDEPSGQHLFVCEYHDRAQGQCTGEKSVFINNTCYINHNKQEDGLQTWFNLTNFCFEHGGKVAQSGLEDISLLNNISLSGSRQYWTGITRRGWQWTNDEPMQYYNWRPSMGDSGDVSYCMELFKGPEMTYQWRDENCDTLHNYFICINLPSTTTTMIQTTALADGVTSKENEIKTEITKEKPTSGQVPVYAYVVPVVVLVLAGVIGAVVFVVLRNRKAKRVPDQPTKGVNNDEYETDEKQPEYENGLAMFEESGYSSVDMDPLPENTISPYGEYEGPTQGTNITKRISNFFQGVGKNKKPPTQEDDDIANMYAKPMKKKRKETMDSKKKRKPAIKSPKPKMDLSGIAAGSKGHSHSPDGAGDGDPIEIDHVEGADGDLYAMPMKKKKESGLNVL